MLINIATYVHIRKFETGNRTNLKRSISVCRYAYNEYKNIFDNISLVNNCNKYLIRFVKIYSMIETLILLGCLYLSIRVTDYVEKQKQ